MKLTATQKQGLRKLARQNDLKLILLYGSYATGKNRADSDLDIAVVQNFKAKKSLEFLKVFDPLVKIFPKYNVDLGILNKSDAVFLYEVMATGKLLYGDKNDYIVFKNYALRRYFDETDLASLKNLLLKKQQIFLKKTYA